MANIGFNDNSVELLELYDNTSNDSGVGYIDNFDGLQMNDLLNSGKTLKKPVIVEELPTEGVESQIYLVKNPDYTDETNRYNEYIWVDGKFEQLGGQEDGSSGGGGTGEDNFAPITKDTLENILK